MTFIDGNLNACGYTKMHSDKMSHSHLAFGVLDDDDDELFISIQYIGAERYRIHAGLRVFTFRMMKLRDEFRDYAFQTLVMTMIRLQFNSLSLQKYLLPL